MSNPLQNCSMCPAIIGDLGDGKREPFPNQSAADAGDKQFSTRGQRANIDPGNYASSKSVSQAASFVP
jgi:hypothetical protein